MGLPILSKLGALSVVRGAQWHLSYWHEADKDDAGLIVLVYVFWHWKSSKKQLKHLKWLQVLVCGQVNLVLKFNTNERWSVRMAELHPTSQRVTSDLKKIATVLCCGHKSIKNPFPHPTSRETKVNMAFPVNFESMRALCHLLKAFHLAEGQMESPNGFCLGNGGLALPMAEFSFISTILLTPAWMTQGEGKSFCWSNFAQELNGCTIPHANIPRSRIFNDKREHSWIAASRGYPAPSYGGLSSRVLMTDTSFQSAYCR